ncbi:hypothetical protein ElyMa_006509200 [Elysia marginata]|uniref:Uncharacterized protein n=1 Tax=Elysia marginata TaxID=1093978 RepID=A0AAV4I4L7_9GAST|nr:hypothetical protein ElyMa_006509200 [Elysia marginata]
MKSYQDEIRAQIVVPLGKLHETIDCGQSVRPTKGHHNSYIDFPTKDALPPPPHPPLKIDMGNQQYSGPRDSDTLLRRKMAPCFVLSFTHLNLIMTFVGPGDDNLALRVSEVSTNDHNYYSWTLQPPSNDRIYKAANFRPKDSVMVKRGDERTDRTVSGGCPRRGLSLGPCCWKTPSGLIKANVSNGWWRDRDEKKQV